MVGPPRLPYPATWHAVPKGHASDPHGKGCLLLGGHAKEKGSPVMYGQKPATPHGMDELESYRLRLKAIMCIPEEDRASASRLRSSGMLDSCAVGHFHEPPVFRPSTTAGTVSQQHAV